MRVRRAMLFLMLGLLIAGPARADDATRGQDGRRSDAQLLQGTWKVVKRVKNGQDEDAAAHPATMRFEGKTVTETRDDGQGQAGTFTIDASATPKRITLTGTRGPDANKTFEAIYSIEGNTLKLAYRTGDRAGTPPADFNGGEGEGLLVLERQRS